MSAAAKSTANELIAGLPSKERERVLAHCEHVPLCVGDVLYETEQSIRRIYFPNAGLISLMATVRGHAPMEVAMVGNEGMLGATISLGVLHSPVRAMVQGDGTAWSMTVAQFQSALRSCPNLAIVVKRTLQQTISQLAQTAVCTNFHEVDARLARWLLMTHDRAHADHFHLTHRLLAEMLGVQRSAVTIAAGLLQRQGLIQYSRGEITILSRGGLEAASCECYAALVHDIAAQAA